MADDNLFGLGLQDPDQTNNDFGFIDFMDEANFEQFIELIRGENAEPAVTFCPNYFCEHISGCHQNDDDNDQTRIITGTITPTTTTGVATPPAVVGELFDLINNDESHRRSHPGDFNNNNIHEFGGDGGNYHSPPSSALLLAPREPSVEENEVDHESSGTTVVPAVKTTRSGKTDRSKTLISERKRRGRMKEKLYALRSLVPNITKMDKASIIGDAVLYIEDLQTNAKKLKAEILNLETSLSTTSITRDDDKYHHNFQEKSTKKNNFFNVTPNPPPATVIKKILQMEIFQMEEREFYGRIVCNKDQGIAALLYKALESLSNFTVHTTNLSSLSHNYVLTFTLLHVEVLEMETEMEMMKLQNLKLWIASVFLNLGFDFQELPQV